MTSHGFQFSSFWSQPHGLLLRLGFALILCLGAFLHAGAAPVPGNRCKDRCNEVYRVKKELCRSIPLKHERKLCEKSAKRSKDDCKHRCR
jgi:hypothetical protein